MNFPQSPVMLRPKIKLCLAKHFLVTLVLILTHPHYGSLVHNSNYNLSLGAMFVSCVCGSCAQYTWMNCKRNDTLATVALLPMAHRKKEPHLLVVILIYGGRRQHNDSFLLFNPPNTEHWRCTHQFVSILVQTLR